MRFYTKVHEAYCGIDLHARSMYVCILNRDGEMMLHRNMPTTPEIFLKAIAPYRQDLVVAVECMFTWYWLADLCVQEGITFVLGHAQYMKAIHGGKAKNDRLDAQKIAVLLRGGMLPQAYVYPATMRATRDLLRRRLHLVRQRAERLTHIRQTNSQYNLPALGPDFDTSRYIFPDERCSSLWNCKALRNCRLDTQPQFIDTWIMGIDLTGPISFAYHCIHVPA
jgi:Transposase